MKKFFILILISISQAPGLWAQESTKSNLELPPVIVEDKSGQLQVRAGSKKDPNKTGGLSAKDLDSLNSLDKEKSFLLAAKKLPDQIRHETFRDGFLRAGYGRFNTPGVDFGYSFKTGVTDEYDFYVNGGVDISDGEIKNSDYSKIYANLTNVYIAPDKFWVFGGSRTKTALHFDKSESKLYAVDSAPPTRDILNINLTMDSDGYYSGVKFETGLGLKTMNLGSGTAKAFDNSVNGYLNIKGYAGDLELGGKVMADVHSVRGDGVYFAQGLAVINYFVPKVSLVLNGGFQIGAGTIVNNTRTSILLSAELEYRISRLLTLKTSIYNSLEDRTLRDYLFINPYLAHNAPIDFKNGRNLKGYLYFHPTAEFTIAAGALIGTNERTPYYISNTNGTFGLGYDKTKEYKLIGEIDWHFTDNDILTANMELNKTEIDSSGNTLPYTPWLKVSGAYRRNWFGKVGTEVGMTYFGSRYADIENDIEIDAFINLNAKVDVKITDTFSVFGKVENILNSDVYVWEGYKERGLFVSGGIFWTF
jgi:hypothetical protein